MFLYNSSAEDKIDPSAEQIWENSTGKTFFARGGGVLSIFVRRGCAVLQGIVFAHFY